MYKVFNYANILLFNENFRINKKYLIHSRWKICPPKERDVLIFDGIKNPFKEYFKKSSYNVLYRRGEEINLFILLICILKLKFHQNAILSFLLNTQILKLF